MNLEVSLRLWWDFPSQSVLVLDQTRRTSAWVALRVVVAWLEVARCRAGRRTCNHFRQDEINAGLSLGEELDVAHDRHWRPERPVAAVPDRPMAKLATPVWKPSSDPVNMILVSKGFRIPRRISNIMFITPIRSFQFLILNPHMAHPSASSTPNAPTPSTSTHPSPHHRSTTHSPVDIVICAFAIGHIP